MPLKPLAATAILAAALLAPTASAQFVPEGRLSTLRSTAFCGNGPLLVTYDETVTENGLMTSGPVTHNHLTTFFDAFWGASDTLTEMTHSVNFFSRGSAGLLIVGQLDPNDVRVRSLAPSQHGASALAQGTTISVFEYRFSLTAPMDWAVGIDATRNPTANFACTLRDATTGQYYYSSPLTAPTSGTGNGVLPAGSYHFSVQQNTFASTGEGMLTATDSSVASFLLRIGAPPQCDPDVNCDGNADQDDVTCLIDAVAGNPGCECVDPDFTADGNVDQDDVAALINVVAGGDCP